MKLDKALEQLGVEAGAQIAVCSGDQSSKGAGTAEYEKLSPIDGQTLFRFNSASTEQCSDVFSQASQAFTSLKRVPAPRRGEFVRTLGQRLRENKAALAAVVTWEAGQIEQEALGEVQEMIDICDFAVGLSRQLYGKTIASERPEHRLTEYWHPLGPVGVISAFNFPVAVWAWNAAIAWVCGDPVVWKPSEKAPLCALACQSLAQQTLAEFPELPSAMSSVLLGGAEVGVALAEARQLPLISATGSVPMGRDVAARVGARLGRSLLELGGNNAAIVTASADLELALRGAAFAAAGTAGQRCTSLRRLLVHKDVYEAFVPRLKQVLASLPVGRPTDPNVLLGPLIDQQAYEQMQAHLSTARAQGGQVTGGQRVVDGELSRGLYVHPALVEIAPTAAILTQETFAPIVHVSRYTDVEDAIQWNNGVPQGLSSAIFTRDSNEAERFCGPTGSDCGIANVNLGTSGAEIGGAFGGEKDTGGGRESGSDAWKAYMRRMTSTINYGSALPLAQGIKFDIN